MPATKMNVVTNLGPSDDFEDEENEPVYVGPTEFTTSSGIRAVVRAVANTTAVGGGAVNARTHYKYISVARISMIDGKS